MLQTKDTIKGFINAGLDMAANRVEDFNVRIGEIFSNAKEAVATVTGATSPAAVKTQLDKDKDKDKDKTKDKATPAAGAEKSAPGKWASERMKNGDASLSAEGAKVGEFLQFGEWTPC